MIDWNSSGRLFHSLWPLKVNARWPAAVLQSGICRRSLFLVLQLCTSDLVLNFWQRYGGASPFKHLNTMVASLTSSCLTTGSHCNCLTSLLYKILPQVWGPVNQPFTLFIHHIWGETVPWGAVFIIQTSDRTQYLTILQYKLHSFNIQDNRSTRALLAKP